MTGQHPQRLMVRLPEFLKKLLKNLDIHLYGFLDSTFDKIAEVAVFLGILVGGFAEPYLVFLAIILHFLKTTSNRHVKQNGLLLH